LLIVSFFIAVYSRLMPVVSERYPAGFLTVLGLVMVDYIFRIFFSLSAGGLLTFIRVF